MEKVPRINLYKDTDKYICHIYKNREEWKSKRIKGIGGSDSSSLVGMNPWKNNTTLWKEKNGILIPDDISDKPQVKYGLEAEQYLRNLFELDFPQYEMQYQDNTTLQSTEFPWMLYSPDGLILNKQTGEKGVFEVKTTNILQSMQREKWKDQIPMNYYIQVLHGLLVTGFDFVILKAQLKYVWGHETSDVNIQTKHYMFTKEEKKDDLEWLLKQEIEQWDNYYKKNIEPPTKLPLI